LDIVGRVINRFIYGGKLAKFEKGHPKLPGAGRPKGLQNQVTRDVREAIARFAECNIDKFVGWLQEVEDPARRCEIFLKTIEYHIPKLTRQEVKNIGPTLADLPDEELDRLVEEYRRQEDARIANMH